VHVDLNADVGEASGIYQSGPDHQLLQVVTSASVACGFHAGDPSVMRRTVQLAARAGVAIGAHPGFPDLVGFGRREINATAQEIADFVLYQIGALSAVAKAEGVRLQHVKPHGALYNMAARRRDVADAIASAVASYDKSLFLIGLPESELLAAGLRHGLRVAAEGFADRSYEPDGSLTPRGMPGAVINDPSTVARRTVELIKEHQVTARDGSVVRCRVDTICVHGDTANAVDLAASVRRALENAGIAVRSIA
jgi:UPF0271 protein